MNMKTESNIKVKNENFEFPKKPNFKGSKCNLLIKKMTKMQNSPSKFHYFSFQSSKFAFCHFSLLSFEFSQFNLLLSQDPYLPLTTQNYTVLAII